MITTLGYTPAGTSLSDLLVVSVCPSFTQTTSSASRFQNSNQTMKSLSLDELYCVLQFCDYKTLCSCIRTCSSWFQVYKKNEQQLYFSLYKSYFTPTQTEMGTQKDWKQMFIERMKLEMKVSKVPKLRHSVIEKSTVQNRESKVDENQSVVSMVDRISQLLSCYREEIMNEESVQLILGEVAQQSFLLRQYHMFRENMRSLILKFPQLKYLRDNLRYQVYKTYDEQLMIYVKLSVELLEVEATMCSRFDEIDIFVQFIERGGEKNTLLLLEDGKPKWDETSLCVLKKRFKMGKMKNEEVKKVLGICLLPLPYSDTVFQYNGNTPFLVRFIQELRNEYFV